MDFKTKHLDIDSTRNIAVMHEKDLEALGLHPDDRVKIIGKKTSITCIVDSTETMVQPGMVGLFDNVYEDIGDGTIQVQTSSKPRSITHIKKKMEGDELTTDEINELVVDMVSGSLSDIELTAYVTSVAINGMNIREIKDLTLAMVETGDYLDFEGEDIFDFHSIGGVPGNKITLLIVPIVAAAGLKIPKTCSRAISSAGGTADIFETVADVSLSIEDIKNQTNTVGGTIAWGGGVKIAPADDIIIRVEYPLSIDPFSQVLASVMAKKKAVGADFLVMDIPMGEGTKVANEEMAQKYADHFITLGREIGMTVQCAITYAGQPVGNAIGPALEMREGLKALEGKAVPGSVIRKATNIAGRILEMGGKADKGKGTELAKELLKNGKALEKMKEIIKAQRGDPNITSDDVYIGKYSQNILAPREGYIDMVGNREMVRIAREAGAPRDKGAGIMLYKKIGSRVEEGDIMFSIYADNERRLEDAVALAQRIQPLRIEGMILEWV